MCIHLLWHHTAPTLQSPDESAEVLEATSSSSSNDESDSNAFHKEQLSNKLVQEAKRTSRLSQASPGEESDSSLEGEEKSAEAVVQRYMERVSW